MSGVYIKLRKRGTNQHQVKGELKNATWCKKCGQFIETARLDTSSGFPEMKRITKCSNCGKDL